MVEFADLWLPILLSAIGVFVASSVIHMALPIHKGDFKKLPGEDKILESMRAQSLKPGSYMFPCAGSMKEMCTPEMQAKLALGPIGNMTVIGKFGMGKSLVQWFLLTLVISAITAAIGSKCLPAGTEMKLVFQVTLLAAFLGYSLSHVQDSIWKGVSWGISFKFIVDGLIYSLVTAGLFAWLWPSM